MKVDDGERVRRGAGAPDDLVLHKPARECYMTEPHRRESCGVVRARRMAQQQGDEKRVKSEK